KGCPAAEFRADTRGARPRWRPEGSRLDRPMTWLARSEAVESQVLGEIQTNRARRRCRRRGPGFLLEGVTRSSAAEGLWSRSHLAQRASYATLHRARPYNRSCECLASWAVWHFRARALDRSVRRWQLELSGRG